MELSLNVKNWAGKTRQRCTAVSTLGELMGKTENKTGSHGAAGAQREGTTNFRGPWKSSKGERKNCFPRQLKEPEKDWCKFLLPVP